MQTPTTMQHTVTLYSEGEVQYTSTQGDLERCVRHLVYQINTNHCAYDHMDSVELVIANFAELVDWCGTMDLVVTHTAKLSYN